MRNFSTKYEKNLSQTCVQLLSGQDVSRPTDRPTDMCKVIYPHFLQGGHKYYQHKSQYSELKTFSDNRLNKAQLRECAHHMLENIMGKVENYGYQHFLHFPPCFKKLSPSKQ